MRLNDHAVTNKDRRKARDLRNNVSPPEKKLWMALRKSSVEKNFHFRRQQPIHPYIVDFACMKAKLLIELDGYSHDVRHNYDQARDACLKKCGYIVLRIGNDEMMANMEGVVLTILLQAETPCRALETAARVEGPPPNPPLKREG